MCDSHGTPRVRGAMHPRFDEILTPEALAFVAKLDGAFAGRRADLLQQRRVRAHAINAGADLDFRPETADIRADDSWRVAPPAPGLLDRRCELISPATRRMGVHALTSGADVWIADLEDSTAPTWFNVVDGQVTLLDAVRGRLTYEGSDGRTIGVPEGERSATIVMRPRGWHLCEKHVAIDGRPISATLLDFGLYFWHNARELVAQGVGPYFYLPKLESAAEARLWNDVFLLAQDELGIPRGTVRATAHIETITSAFEMDEILYELREHCAGLIAGRWDYIFSYVRTFAHRGEEFVLPDRSQITMTTPFMRALTELLIATCHRRGAYAIGGPSAYNPAVQGEEAKHRALSMARSEKEREASEGFDGSWVAHPALVEACQTAYRSVLGDRHNQLDVTPEVEVDARRLLSLRGTQHVITLQGVRTNVSVALRYLAGWIGGRGAVAIDALMEDASTIEISRAQLWQWLHHRSQLAEGPQVTRELLDRIVDEEMAKLSRGASAEDTARLAAAKELLEQVAFADYLPGFFTPYAYVRHLTDDSLRMSGPLRKERLRESERMDAGAGGSAA